MNEKSKNAKEFTEYYQSKHVTSTYDKQRGKSKYRRKKRDKELRFFLDLIGKKPKEKVLELGCSSGFLTEHLGEVTAIDTSEGMLKIAHSKNPQAKVIHADMFDLPFKNNSFDKVITMRVWNHLDKNDLRKALREVKRVLKKNGNLIFDAEDDSRLRRIAAYWYQAITRITGFKIYQYSLSMLKKILAEEGFKIERGKFLYHRIGRQIILRTRLTENQF